MYLTDQLNIATHRPVHSFSIFTNCSTTIYNYKIGGHSAIDTSEVRLPVKPLLFHPFGGGILHCDIPAIETME